MSTAVRKLGPITLNDRQDVYFYSLARHALSHVFYTSRAVPGQKVLLPTFICRDLLAAVNNAGLIPVWYETNEDLKPAQLFSDWPSANFVLAINYFGFPQNLAPFRSYVNRCGAILIEDNAHGFLSRDVDGAWLGTRAPYGLFSVRKTFRMRDGAAVLINEMAKEQAALTQLPFNGRGLNSAEEYKSKIRAVPLIGRYLLRMTIRLVRYIRKLYSGSEVPLGDAKSELEFPIGPNPWFGLTNKLGSFDFNLEIRRRQETYAYCLAFCEERAGVEPIFKNLPIACAPYGFPFRCDRRERQSMQLLADELGSDLITWPDLPSDLIDASPGHHSDVLVINFLL